MNVSELSENQKINFMIMISKRAISYMKENKYYGLLEKSIKECEEWSDLGKYSGEYFYEVLDNEENGLAMLQCEDENEQYTELRNCVINTVAYVSRKAYEKDKIFYYPEPILLVSDDIVKDSMDALLSYEYENEEYINLIYEKCKNLT